jgi:hypothetical protein
MLTPLCVHAAELMGYATLTHPTMASCFCPPNTNITLSVSIKHLPPLPLSVGWVERMRNPSWDYCLVINRV